MQSNPSRLRRSAALVAAAVLVVFGIAAVVQGASGRATVHGALSQEAVVGVPTMQPEIAQATARKAGLTHVEIPTCTVAGQPVDDGASARCFAEYMHFDALMATGGKTYAQMPRFATKDGKGTNIEAQAMTGPGGRAVDNPARNVWVTATALSNALNTSYMAEQVSLFGIAVGGAFLLIGLALAAFALAGVRMPSVERVRSPQPDAAMS